MVLRPSITELLGVSWPRLAFLIAKGGRETKFWSTEREQGVVFQEPSLNVGWYTSSVASSVWLLAGRDDS